ncbi:MAG: hypothetical protein WC867_02725 [Candidatus Pacearchaeota archaeon]|jgi:hypothetical protein
MKKKIGLSSILIVFLSLYFISLISAIDLAIESKPISDSYIVNLNIPTSYELTIKNNGENDSFWIDSLIGVDITPEAEFYLKKGDSTKLIINVVPQEALKERRGYITFQYIIKNSRDEVQNAKLTMNILSLEDAIIIIPSEIKPNDETINIKLKNTLDYDFSDFQVEMDSAFFSYRNSVPIKPLETVSIDIPLDKNNMKTLTSGQYLINVKIITAGKTVEKEIITRYLENDNIETKENKEGILIERKEMIKKNNGNIKKIVLMRDEKNAISYLFTSFNIPSTRTEWRGLKKYYAWEKELNPNEELRVIITTNWLYPIGVIILIFVVLLLVKRFVERDIVLKKDVSFVQTRGGEFALKVTLRVKARKYSERIKIVDKIPMIVNLYEKYGAIAPDKVDTVNKRLEWNIEMLNTGEERIFSYIIYSRIGVVGRFELPPARALYERDGEVKDVLSNRAFFINEPKKKKN